MAGSDRTDPEATPQGPPVDEPERRLPEGYYVDNFQLVLRTVVRRYRDLLKPEELAFAQGFRALSRPARRLYVRLVSRRGPLFRRDRLDYPEIPDLGSALAELLDAGFADRGEEVATESFLPLLLRPELDRLARELLDGAAPARCRKEELVEAVVEHADPGELRRSLRQRLEIIRPLHDEHIVVFRLLFFGNLSQDWTEFVLRDLGVVRFERYKVRRDLRRFPCRAALDDALLLRQYRFLVSYLLELGELDNAVDLARTVLEMHATWHPTARRHADRILNQIGRELERRGDAEQALAYYAAAVAPPARERRVRLLTGLGHLEEALVLCREILDDPRDETEAIFAPRFAHRLRRRLGERLPPRRRRRRPVVEMTLERLDGMPVEELALDELAQRGQIGFFAENWLWKTLFGLAFWDVIFAPVAGAFQHPFQYGPLDFHTPEFRRARRDAVHRRLAELAADPSPGPRLLAVWDEKVGVANRLVSWMEGERPLLELALSRLTGAQLAVVCDRLSRDPGRYRRGLPDLFVLTAEDDPASPGFELFEVKAPGDQLRPEQKGWIDYLNERGIPTSILKVRWGSEG